MPLLLPIGKKALLMTFQGVGPTQNGRPAEESISPNTAGDCFWLARR
jgi:hypothetical protein